MIGFAQGVLVGLSLGGVWVGSCIGKSIAYGLGSGLTSGIIAIALDKLLGRKVSSAYLAAVVIYGIGKVWNKAVDPINTKPSTIPLYKRFTKDDLCRLTKENLEFISQRCYTNDSDESQNVVQLKSGDALCQQSERFEALSQVSTQPRYTETKITVINQDFLDAACEEVKQGHQVAVVSFGSPREPGGGFEEGTIGQEEELCYRSELAGFMYDQVYDKLGTDLQL